MQLYRFGLYYLFIQMSIFNGALSSLNSLTPLPLPKLPDAVFFKSIFLIYVYDDEKFWLTLSL